MDSLLGTAESSSTKRPRSPSGDNPLPASKVAKTHANHLQINYLARQFNENIPLVSADDTLPSILRLIGDYDGVVHRHESIAGNLGACPLGPILIKRFERLFDGPPRVLKSHGKEGTTVSWLDVVEFARNKPEQFNLEKMRNGVRVCQFYTKQSRVEISEEDYVLIASGMPQKLIPPQPIMEDEEKELGALEILEKNLGQIIQLADQVSARARQLNHRLKNRKAAIISRRENEAIVHTQSIPRSASPPVSRDFTNGSEANSIEKRNGSSQPPHSPPAGFVAVNARQSHPSDGSSEIAVENGPASSQLMFPQANTDKVTIINGTSIKGASPTTRAELMKKFFSTADRNARGHPADEDVRRSSPGLPRPSTASRPKPRPSDAASDYSAYLFGTNSTAVPIPSTPSSLLPHMKPSQPEKDDGGPYKSEMMGRMESLVRGERVLPPCDRCRRLHMDCLKNLTACMGCTKKHAKCSWKDVREEELRDGRQEVSEHERMEDIPNEEHAQHSPDREHFPETPPAEVVIEETVDVVVPGDEHQHEESPEHAANKDRDETADHMEHKERVVSNDDDDGVDHLQATIAEVVRSASQGANS